MVNGYLKRVSEKINVLEDTIEMLSDAQLKDKTNEFRSKLQVARHAPVPIHTYHHHRHHHHGHCAVPEEGEERRKPMMDIEELRRKQRTREGIGAGCHG